MIQIGQVVSGKYRLLRLLGDGGMGSVYEAQHEILGTKVAIKVLHADLARRPGLIERFLQEARVAAQIRSANVVHVTDVDRTPEGVAYIVMDLLEGEPLSSVLERDRKIPIATAIDYTKQVLEALEAAHALGVVHRDLKPENVFVTFVGNKPVIKLIDFGIAKLRSSDPQARSLTVAGVMMGTAEYMAPEQAYSADKVDARSDIYAVGVMLYEMISGVRPVSGEDARLIAVKIERGDVRPLVHAAPEVPRELAGLVHRAMAARAELRFGSAAEMRLALDNVSLSVEKRQATSPLEAQARPPQLSASTVLGAPAESAFMQPAQPPGALGSAKTQARSEEVRTAPPGMNAQAGRAWVPEHGPHHNDLDARRPKRKKRSSMWMLIALPLLLGVGVVVALVVNNMKESPTPTLPTATQITPATATPTAPTPTAPTNEPVAPLTPLVGTTTPAVRPSPLPRTSSSASSSARPTASETPPNGQIPPFPSTFPSTFPFPLPSMSVPPGFTIPSGFPFPQPPPPAPSPPASS